MTDIIEQGAEHLIESERLDTPLQILTYKSWIGLSFFILVVLGLLFWSVLGKIPVTVSGVGVLFDPGSMANIKSKYQAEVRQIHAKAQKWVKKGDLLFELQLIEDNKLGQSYQITAPMNGEVQIINVVPGSVVQPGDELIFIQNNVDVKTLKILSFVPFYPGQNLESGMKVRLRFPSVELSSYGSLEGNVGIIFPYMPDLKDYYVQMLPSQTLREQVLSNGPQKMFLVDPVLDPANPTGLAWTKGKGPAQPLQAGRIGFLQVEVAYVRPLSYIFPSKGLKEGQ